MRLCSHLHAPVALLATTICCLLVAGCGSGSSVQRLPLQGTVSVNGVPVEQGTINFFPLQEGGLAAIGLIQDGQYSFSKANGPCAGRNRVVIGIARALPTDGPTSFGDDGQPLTPASAKNAPTRSGTTSNATSTAEPTKLQWELEYDLPAEGAERKDFDLE